MMGEIKWPQGVPARAAGLSREEFLKGCVPMVKDKYPDVSDEVAELRCELGWLLYDSEGRSAGSERRELEEAIEELGGDAGKVWTWERRMVEGRVDEWPTPIVDDPGLKSLFLEQVADYYARKVYRRPAPNEYDWNRAAIAWSKSEASKRESEVAYVRGPIKVKATGDSYSLGGYAVVFGGRDLEGDKFTPSTDLWMERMSRWPLLYHHGRDEHIGKAIIGDVVKRRKDEVGLWVEAQLSRYSEYVEGVIDLCKRGVLGMSTGSASHLVRRSSDNELLTWPVVEVSLTPTPAEPRTLGVSALRALAEFDAEVKNWLASGVLRGEVKL